MIYRWRLHKHVIKKCASILKTFCLTMFPITKEIYNSFNGFDVQSVFLDISKAFDKAYMRVKFSH